MKKQIKQIPETELLEKYPIKGRTNGWYYCVNEVSNNVYRIEGIDCWGRKVSMQGLDPDKLIEEAEREALRINIEAKDT